ncbi:MAG TPA: 1-(5-phosphoribosyl)-5-[(5-phosphoribosylamino)methylideneamino] imidazole-4-carboxamide isomerase [Candidatus Limnocylindrales bacterium]|nr:1-(5-phosphoribosyl)-5-[(5-phosphoribosylamino)methylideneamino] imidazole-4-carboxamide isomerase [Candidatus Limnocylindrales bacterium]
MLKRYHGAEGSATFDVIPAIDLYGGRVVRLSQGDFERETAYSAEPASVAAAFLAAGARTLHVVDLDGARSGRPAQREAEAAILDTARNRAACQVAGGLRTGDDVAAALDLGAARVVVGTAALADPAFAARLVAEHGVDRIVVALDVRDGVAVGEGWREGAAGVGVDDAIARLSAAGIGTFAVTAIDRDGLLGGPDVALLERLVALRIGDVIASGGIAGIDDIGRVRDIGCVGVIVGRAIYEGRVDLAAAVAEYATG